MIENLIEWFSGFFSAEENRPECKRHECCKDNPDAIQPECCVCERSEQSCCK